MFCRDAGIDDPVSWYNAVDPRVIDLWAALAIFENTDAGKMQRPADALGRIVDANGITDDGR